MIRYIDKNCDINTFKKIILEYIVSGFNKKEWKHYKYFRVYVSLKSSYDNLIVIQPRKYGWLGGKHNPCAFTGVEIKRSKDINLYNSVVEHFVKYCK